MTSIKDRYTILIKDLCIDFLKIIGNEDDDDINKNKLRIKCRALLWQPKGKNMNKIEILWYDDLTNALMHAAFSKKEYTLCNIKIGEEMKFKNLYDYSNFSKCEKCSKAISNIYKGII